MEITSERAKAGPKCAKNYTKRDKGLGIKCKSSHVKLIPAQSPILTRKMDKMYETYSLSHWTTGSAGP